MIREPLTRRLVLDAPHVVTGKLKTGSLARRALSNPVQGPTSLPAREPRGSTPVRDVLEPSPPGK